MNIGIVCYPTFGGSGVVATELGKALAEKGHHVHFITYKMPFRLDTIIPNVYYHEVLISDYDLFDYAPYELSLTNKMVDVALHENLDLMHVHYAIPHASAAYTAKQILAESGKSLPYITTLHGTDITLIGKDPSYKEVITFALNQSDRITAVSESLRKDTLMHFVVKKDIQVVPNFICAENYIENPNGSLRSTYAPNNEKIIMHVSNFREVKRVEDVLKTFLILRKEISARLILVGDGPDRHKIEELCREEGCEDDVVLLGKLTQTISIRSIADLFLLPSQTESFGLAALEACASGVPVISTNTGGLPEVNIHGETGFLSDVGDVDDMAKNALTILKDEKTLNAFKGRAREHAKKFDIKKVLPLYEKLYEEVVKS
ncbi:MAG TPA: N-acetyl-alpha-D-glucosaminyl L-malate synthase BshA [Flavobacteriales bacterium]|nr:N-acetyl-alpha-D-glucosaminyl L-malate synthase BshA [Flavobacteriales bacterium]HIO71899.1 N-acetyl-alpha-D-glucosaminyl L-malate synthase BshA [Flavobacteriales bacterium]